MKRILFIACCLLAANFSIAQIGKIPVAVTEAFSKQYPAAKEVSYDDNLAEYRVHFKLDTSVMTARYNAKGEWRGSEQKISIQQLSPEVLDGFKKSKYADWNVLAVELLYLTEKNGGGEQFRIRVGLNEIDKRYLYFNRTGRLVRDTWGVYKNF